MKSETLLRGRVCIGKAPDGRNLNKYVTAATEEELEAKKEAIRQESQIDEYRRIAFFHHLGFTKD